MPALRTYPHVLGGSFSVVPDPISPTTVSIYLLMLGTQRVTSPAREGVTASA